GALPRSTGTPERRGQVAEAIGAEPVVVLRRGPAGEGAGLDRADQPCERFTRLAGIRSALEHFTAGPSRRNGDPPAAQELLERPEEQDVDRLGESTVARESLRVAKRSVGQGGRKVHVGCLEKRIAERTGEETL